MSSTRSLRRSVWLMLTVDTAGGVIPTVVMQLFRSYTSWHVLGSDMVYGLVYAHCIGTLAFSTMGRIARCVWRWPKPYAAAAIFSALVVIAVAGSVIANAIFVLLGMNPAGAFWPSLRFGLKISILVTLLIGTMTSVFEGLSYRLQEVRLELRTRQVEEERARKLASEARLSSLESRIHPHFLFNTLNSISALIREDPARAERTVERLAALLRFSLDTGRKPLVPLRQKLRVVRDYLEIEKTRFADRLRFTIDVPEGIDDLEVPPMALQTLVENSIKHAVSASRGGGEIRISAHLQTGALLLEVSDDGPGFDLRAVKEGHGLEILQERLAALFAGEGRLEIAQRDGRMVVTVAVPQNKVLV